MSKDKSLLAPQLNRQTQELAQLQDPLENLLISVRSRRVTSPGGTTERAIGEFQKSNFEGIVLQAIQAAADRARELAAEFGKE